MTPALEDLIAHRGRAVLLDRVVDSSDTDVRCSVRVRDDFPYLVEGRLPAIVSVELMAQAVAALAGLRARREGGSPRVGYLIGVRGLQLRAESFAVGQELTVGARVTWNDRNIGTFDCGIDCGGSPLAEASLTVYEPPAEQ